MEVITRESKRGVEVQVLLAKDERKYLAFQSAPVLGFGGSHIMSYEDAQTLRTLLNYVLPV